MFKIVKQEFSGENCYTGIYWRPHHRTVSHKNALTLSTSCYTDAWYYRFGTTVKPIPLNFLERTSVLPTIYTRHRCSRWLGGMTNLWARMYTFVVDEYLYIIQLALSRDVLGRVFRPTQIMEKMLGDLNAVTRKLRETENDKRCPICILCKCLEAPGRI